MRHPRPAACFIFMDYPASFDITEPYAITLFMNMLNAIYLAYHSMLCLHLVCSFYIIQSPFSLCHNCSLPLVYSFLDSYNPKIICLI